MPALLLLTNGKAGTCGLVAGQQRAPLWCGHRGVWRLHAPLSIRLGAKHTRMCPPEDLGAEVMPNREGPGGATARDARLVTID